MARKTVFAPGEFYHLYNRGTDKRKIFNTKQDCGRFVSLLYLSNNTKPFHVQALQTKNRDKTSIYLQEREETLVDVCAYVLMPNHFHLLVREKESGGISKFMQKLTTGYTMYFNTRHERTGALFQGVFKSTHASEDRYLKYLISYIHLNPVKLMEPQWKESGIIDRKKAEAFLHQFEYSSYRDYQEENRIEKAILNTAALPSYFETPKDFETIVTDWLSFK